MSESKFSIESSILDELITCAINVKENAYAPYSNFRVGVSVLGDNNKIYSGTNVENASYGLTLCAERVAICNAISGGVKSIKVIVVNTDINKFKWCCGACCGFILEFGEDIQVISVKNDRTIQQKGIRDLVPFSFSAKDLNEKKHIKK